MYGRRRTRLERRVYVITFILVIASFYVPKALASDHLGWASWRQTASNIAAESGGLHPHEALAVVNSTAIYDVTLEQRWYGLQGDRTPYRVYAHCVMQREHGDGERPFMPSVWFCVNSWWLRGDPFSGKYRYHVYVWGLDFRTDTLTWGVESAADYRHQPGVDHQPVTDESAP